MKINLIDQHRNHDFWGFFICFAHFSFSSFPLFMTPFRFTRNRVHNAVNKSYGIGVYIAEHAIYSHAIRPHVNIRNKNQLIFVSVVRGRCKEYGYAKAKTIDAKEPDGFHSVTGTEEYLAFLQGWIDDEMAKPNPNLQAVHGYKTLLRNGAKYGQ